MIAAVVITLNEEANLRDCLDSVSFVDQVLVFDSFSTDCTLEIAKTHGAKTAQRRFDNYAMQRNAALALVAPEIHWILMLDADERVSPGLQKEIINVTLTEGNDTALYRIRRKDMFMGRWIKHSSAYPTWFGRLFRQGKVVVGREINEEYRTSGKVGFLKEHLIHFPFSKGVAYWLERHNRYSTMEASTLNEERQRRLQFADSVSLDPSVRRRFAKQLAYRFPARPLITFFYLSVIRMGVLDGSAGLRFCLMRAMYEYMIDLKMLELRRRAADEPV